MSSYSYSESQTFTVTHAKHLAAKVATDLKRMQRFYGEPSDNDIEEYEIEIIELLRNGYLGSVSYGYVRNEKWIEPTIKFDAKDLALGIDDDPGRISIGAHVDGASFYSFLTYSNKWDSLSPEERDNFKKTLPFYRGGASEPGINGFLVQDKTYSSGGRALNRSTVKSY